MNALLQDLVAQGCEFWMDERHLMYDGPDEALTDEIVRQLWSCRTEIEAWLSARSREDDVVVTAPIGATTGRCVQHIDPADWEDELVGARIRTACRSCGGFIGYRPKANA